MSPETATDDTATEETANEKTAANSSGAILEVSEAAVEKVLEVRAEEEDPALVGLRVEITGSSGPDYTYDLAFEPIAEAAEDDVIYTQGELTLMVPLTSVENLTGATLDLPSNPMQGGLVIRNPNRPKMLEGEELNLTGTIEEKLQQLLNQHINPSLAAHGGFAELVKMEPETVAHIRMGGGCQGCSMSAATLRQGIEVMIAEALPEITEVVDVTDHDAGENPFFS